jgi:outer membrane biosynthesis protein TonB
MSTTQIPPRGPVPPSVPPPRTEPGEFYDAQHWETAYRTFDPDDVPHLLIQLQDDLARSRKREALWLSVILHLTIVMLLANSDRIARYLPHRHDLMVIPLNAQREKDATFLELPPDEQQVTKRPETDKMSDKNRIATSKKPQIDPKELKNILDAARAGAPGPGGPPTPPQPAQAPQVAQAPAEQPQSQPEPQQASPPPASSNQIAKVTPPPPVKAFPKPSFGGSVSARSAVEEAAKAVAANRGGYGGDSGNFGTNLGTNGARTVGNYDVLSDTMGVDFGPYLARVVQNVRTNWYTIVPESALPPIMKKGKLAIEFAIMKDGKVAGMRYAAQSGDVALDRAAWGGITNSNPFPPLPQEFAGQYLYLRFYFYYNPDGNELK